MAEFTTLIDIDPDEYWDECSRSEKEELIDLMVEDGWVVRTSPKGTNPKDTLPSVADLDWQDMVNKLSVIRNQIRKDDEEIIINLLKKY